MLRKVSASVLLCVLSATLLAQNTPPAGQRPNGPARASETWLAELLMQQFDVPKDAFQGDVDRLVRGYQERLNRENADPKELGETIQLVLKLPEMTDPKEQMEAAKRITGVREKGGSALSELFAKLGPTMKPTPEQFERFALVESSFDPQTPLIFDPIARSQRIIDTLPETVKLTPEQRAQFDAMRSDLKEAMAATTSATDLRKQAETERNAGRTEKAMELDRKADEIAATFEANVEGMLDKLDGILDPQQRQVLADLRVHAAVFGGQVGADPRQDVKTILRAARRLQLNENQRSRVDDLTRVAARTLRELGSDRPGREALASQVMNELRTILQPAQFGELERELARQDRRGRHDGAGGRK